MYDMENLGAGGWCCPGDCLKNRCGLSPLLFILSSGWGEGLVEKLNARE
jgi:hypothetical protein